MPMSMAGSVSGASCAGPMDETGTAFQLALGLGRLGLGAPQSGGGGGGGRLSDSGRLDMAGFQDALRESRKSCNMTECVSVPSSEHVAEIVGRQGCKIKALRAKTNTYIKTPVRGEEPVFVVTGRRDDVTSAKREILSAAEHFSQIRASRRSGAAGSGCGAAGAHAGGGPICASSAEAAASSLGVACSPVAGGAVTAVSPAAAPGQVTAMVRVPYRVVGLVVGPKGATIKRIQQTTSTYIVTPSRDKDPVFEVTGLPESVEKARAEIERHIASRAGGDATAAVGLPSGGCGSAARAAASAVGCFNDAIGCGGGRLACGSAFLGFGGSCCGSSGPCRDPGSVGSGFAAYPPLAAAAAQQAASVLDLGGLGRLDGGAAADDILSARGGEGDSGCGASLASDLDCGGVVALSSSSPSSAIAGAPAAMRLPFSTSSIWSNPVSCGASVRAAGAAAALRDDALSRSSYAAAGGGVDHRGLAVGGGSLPRRHSTGARQSPPVAAAVAGDPCAAGGGCCCQSLSRRRSQEGDDGMAPSAACGFSSAAIGAFPASSSSSSGCSSTSTSPVVERRQRCGGGDAPSPCFGGGATAAGSYFGGGGLKSAGGGRLLGGGGEESAGGSCGIAAFTAAAVSTPYSSYPWCYGLDQAAAAFDERVCGSF